MRGSGASSMARPRLTMKVFDALHPAHAPRETRARKRLGIPMKSMFLAASAAIALLACGPAAAAPQARPTPADAKAFVERAETQLAAMSEYANRAQWVRANFITTDTEWLEAKVSGEQKELVTRLAKEAAKFNGVKADPATTRKLMLLKLYLSLPAPDRPGAAAEVARLNTKL